MTHDETAIRRILLRRLRALGQRLDGIETELLTHGDADWSEQAVEREDDEVLEQLGLAGQEEIRQIRAALERLDRHRYGICTSCGERIEEDRLAALPATPFCRACALAVAA